MKVQIIVDSTVDMPEHSRSACRVVPLTVHFGEESFIDGVTLNKQDFYRRLAEGGALPTTSQATPAAFQSVFDEVTRAGDSAVVITLASQFSGTYQSACIAAEDYENIYVVDSRTAAIGSGILAEYALRCAEQGMEAGALAALLEKKREDVRLFALLDTLEYLKRGGRISKTVAFAGGLLNIKPLITVEDGEVLVVGKARGAKQGMALPVLWNTGGYETVEAVRGNVGFVDAYLTDFKYADGELAARYSRAADYPEVALAALKAMVEATGAPCYDEFRGQERFVSGVIVRHLMLPGALENSKAVVRLLHERFGSDVRS